MGRNLIRSIEKSFDKKPKKEKQSWRSNGQKVTLVREEPFAAARDSVDFKVYLMIWKEKQGNRVAEIEEF